jgi:hypothetical protein
MLKALHQKNAQRSSPANPMVTPNQRLQTANGGAGVQSAECRAEHRVPSTEHGAPKHKMTKQKRTRRRPSCCADCGERWAGDASPMVRDEVWRSIGGRPRTLLCDLCLRQRLGRPLLYRDLDDCPFNDGWLRPETGPSDPVPWKDFYIGRYVSRCRRRRQPPW